MVYRQIGCVCPDRASSAVFLISRGCLLQRPDPPSAFPAPARESWGAGGSGSGDGSLCFLPLWYFYLPLLISFDIFLFMYMLCALQFISSLVLLLIPVDTLLFTCLVLY